MLKVVATWSVVLATFISVLDTTIVNVALPKIEGGLLSSRDQGSWLLVAYVMAEAVMLPLTGVLVRRFGRKQVVMASIAGFTIASLLCGAATSIEQLVVLRALQGAAGAALMPLSQAVLLDINPPKDHGPAMALWGLGVMAAPVLGPVLGGVLTEQFGWRYIFLVNLPIGALALAGVAASLPATTMSAESRFNVWGWMLLATGLGLFQLTLGIGERVGWTHAPLALLSGFLSAVLLYAFVIHNLRAGQPFVTRSLFRDRNFLVGQAVTFVQGLVLLSSMATIAPFFQEMLGCSASVAGALLAPRGVGMMVGMLVVGRLIARTDVRALMTIGFVTTAATLYITSQLPLDSPLWRFIAIGVAQGLGMGLVIIPLSTTTFATLPPIHRSEATAFFTLVNKCGASFGVAIVLLVMGRTSIQTDIQATGFATLVRKTMVHAAYINAMLFLAACCLVCAPMAYLFRRPQLTQPPADLESANAVAAVSDEVGRAAI